MGDSGWRRGVALELRYDGPVPFWEMPPPPVTATLIQRMRLHRRLAREYAAAVRRQLDCVDGGEAGRVHHEAAQRCRRDLAEARRAHSALAAALGAARRGTAL